MTRTTHTPSAKPKPKSKPKPRAPKRKAPKKPQAGPAEPIGETPPRPVGRPSKFKPEYVAVAEALCKRGATDHELAQEFEVSTPTIWRWTVQHDEFCNALRAGKDAFDDRVERSLAMRAIGYSYEAEKAFCQQGIIIKTKVIEHVPPDPNAAKLWLTSRRPQQWRDSSKMELTGRDGGPLQIDAAPMTDLEVARRIAFALQRAAERLKGADDRA